MQAEATSGNKPTTNHKDLNDFKSRFQSISLQRISGFKIKMQNNGKTMCERHSTSHSIVLHKVRVSSAELWSSLTKD